MKLVVAILQQLLKLIERLETSLGLLRAAPPNWVSLALQFGPTAHFRHLLSFMFLAATANGSSDLHYQLLEHNGLTQNEDRTLPSPPPLDKELSGRLLRDEAVPPLPVTVP